MIGDFYRGGAKLNLTPVQIDQMSLWDYNQMMAGWMNYHHPKTENEKPIDKNELMEMFGVNEEMPSFGGRLTYKPKE